KRLGGSAGVGRLRFIEHGGASDSPHFMLAPTAFVRRRPVKAGRTKKGLGLLPCGSKPEAQVPSVLNLSADSVRGQVEGCISPSRAPRARRLPARRRRGRC